MVAEGSPGSVNPSPDSVNPSPDSVVDEEGLPSPPLDEGAFLAPQTTSIELSQVQIFQYKAFVEFCLIFSTILFVLLQTN